jgi:N-carbamoyl-L-amino-acid hydrolase
MSNFAFVGVRDIETIRSVRDAARTSVGEALDILHAAFPELPRKALGFTASGYLELHIEQGPLLKAANRVIGVVTAIQGKKTFRVTIDGAEGHAGTLAQQERRDAVAAFAWMATALHAEIGRIDAEIKFTIGRVVVEPNAPSVVPSRVIFTIDLRPPDNAVLDAAGIRVAALCHDHTAPCAVTVTPLVDAPSNGFNPRLRDLIAQAARARDLPAMPILSAAGHDARHLAKVCPSAMIFIPCQNGASHVEHEWSERAHVVAGASVLAQVVRDLVGGGAA